MYLKFKRRQIKIIALQTFNPVGDYEIFHLFAERLSARQLILRRISEMVAMYVSMYVCMYVSRLGIQLFPALRSNLVLCAPV